MRDRNPLPAGTSAIGMGLVVNGLATYGFLIIARRSLGDAHYGGLAVLWGLVYILGPGLFQPLEQEVARATAHRASQGLGSAPVLRKASVIGSVELAVVIVAVLVAWPLGLDDLLDHRIGLLAALIFALASFAAAELVRGVLSGRHRFACYGRYFAVEGGSRLVFAVVGVRSVGAYAVTLAGAFALAAFVSLGSERPFVRPGPEAGYRELTPALGLLLVASLGEAFTLNVGPVALDLIAPEGIGEDAPGVLLDGLIISRIPLFFFQAVKASLLPSLAALAGSDELHRFRDVQLRIVAAVLGLAASAVAVSAAAGPWLVETLFGDQLGSRDMALLAASGGGLMVQLSLGLGLVALGHTRLAVVGWVVAVASFPFVIQLADEPFLRVELAMVASVVLGSLVTGGLLGLRYEAHVAEGRVAPATSADPGDRHGATADSGPVDGGSAGA